MSPAPGHSVTDPESRGPRPASPSRCWGSRLPRCWGGALLAAVTPVGDKRDLSREQHDPGSRAHCGVRRDGGTAVGSPRLPEGQRPPSRLAPFPRAGPAEREGPGRHPSAMLLPAPSTSASRPLGPLPFPLRAHSPSPGSCAPAPSCSERLALGHPGKGAFCSPRGRGGRCLVGWVAQSSPSRWSAPTCPRLAMASVPVPLAAASPGDPGRDLRPDITTPRSWSEREAGGSPSPPRGTRPRRPHASHPAAGDLRPAHLCPGARPLCAAPARPPARPQTVTCGAVTAQGTGLRPHVRVPPVFSGGGGRGRGHLPAYLAPAPAPSVSVRPEVLTAKARLPLTHRRDAGRHRPGICISPPPRLSGASATAWGLYWASHPLSPRTARATPGG